ncbi:MAG TPA: bifunctional riboflavin kinase/FAD synthetase [Chloroflexota bacterium]|nr:bifunctional riboflavin kinase/FAD synthetase [Chloroflexota bacterium]
MMLVESLLAAGIRGPTVVSIGTFDGVHIGHRHLIEETARRARAHSATALALTFSPRPAEILRPDAPSLYLCSLDERCRRLREAGADSVVVVEFNWDLARLSAEDFTRVLVQNAGMRELVGGPDLTLGRNREGTVPVLRDLGERLGFEVTIVSELALHDEPVRTSAIRRALEAGDVIGMSRILGRRYSVEGTVVRGDGRGKSIGIPTANVSVDDKIALPRNGVYAVYFYENGHRRAGAGNLGIRPTFDRQTRTLEIHVLDFEGDLYGQKVNVEFVRLLRPEVRFSGVGELVAQINRDVEDARDALV